MKNSDDEVVPEEQQDAVRIAIIILSSIGIILSVLLLRSSCKKIAQILRPNPDLQNAKIDTYCSISLYIVAMC